jgi:SEC-C motif-containing protein
MTDEYDPQAQMQAIDKQVGAWFDAFVSSSQYQRLSEIERDKAPGIVRFFAEFSFRYIGAAPEQWSRGVLTECCLEILPGKMSAEIAFFQAVTPVLSAFFDFLAARNLLSNAGNLSKLVAGLSDDIVAASQDERNWGPSKAFIMAAERAGVDTCDADALRRFMIEYNLRQVARMEAARTGSRPRPRSMTGSSVPVHPSEVKPGRNDPCPCGSGKKYKRCCGAANHRS